MPNKRSENKDYLSAWIDADLKDELKRLAKERGVSMSEIVNHVVREEVSEYKVREKKHGSK
jgi:antitoxin component of RelBE/YafQ-DinJ toxin-antitoxin module